MSKFGTFIKSKIKIVNLCKMIRFEKKPFGKLVRHINLNINDDFKSCFSRLTCEKTAHEIKRELMFLMSTTCNMMMSKFDPRDVEITN